MAQPRHRSRRDPRVDSHAQRFSPKGKDTDVGPAAVLWSQRVEHVLAQHNALPDGGTALLQPVIIVHVSGSVQMHQLWIGHEGTGRPCGRTAGLVCPGLVVIADKIQYRSGRLSALVDVPVKVAVRLKVWIVRNSTQCRIAVELSAELQ